ncbi:hypothetical protein O1157_33665 [Streptomyces albogriseolus]
MSGEGRGSAGRGTWAGVAATALPLYLSMISASAAALVDTALLGNHSTATLAAFAVAMAVFSPATAMVAGALRGVMPFVTPSKEEPGRLVSVVRSGMWLAVAAGALGAAAVVSVPVIGDVAGVPGPPCGSWGSSPCCWRAVCSPSRSVRRPRPSWWHSGGRSR